MGLDMYAYAAAKAQTEWDEDGTEQRELAYWRKHPNLHGWMEKLAEEKGLTYSTFNGVELELTWEDLDILERDITSGKVAGLQTQGFFFGDPSDDYYRDRDLKFIREARAELFSGLKVFYNSSW